MSDAGPVVIVGAGPVGMSAALQLARFEIPCLLLERRRGLSEHPKARGIRLRTMELFRQWGIADQLLQVALPQEAMRFIYCETLAGREIARTPPVEVDEGALSPTTACRVAQDVVERVLRDRVEAEPKVDLVLGAEVEGVDRCDDGVDVHYRLAGSERTVRGDHLIAADGVGSGVRRALSIGMDGPESMAYWQSIYWRGDISEWVRDRPCIQFFTRAETGSFVTVASVDGKERWVSLITLPPGGEKPSPPSEERCVQIVREAVGDPGLAVDILDVTTFRLSAQVAARYRVGNIFLAGDAAHALPPTGGFGMNTGIQDVHNLVWKLALVRGGEAPSSLLGTYETERLPVARQNRDWSVANSKRMRDIRKALAEGNDAQLRQVLLEQRDHIGAFGQDLGFRYRRGALVDDGTPDLEPGGGHYMPTARPGHRAPHVWLSQGLRRFSTLDLFDKTFTLLAGSKGEGWVRLAEAFDGSGTTSIRSFRIAPGVSGEDALADHGVRFEEIYGTGEEGAVLVRPDGHVAWRSTARPVDDDALTRVMVAVLMQGTETGS